ncbi:hypothetical protein ENBRE01_3175 [Enteropsectra breve]|nr:hypothetical protein ENBRE01_3175 [Enteropsectra breve]
MVGRSMVLLCAWSLVSFVFTTTSASSKTSNPNVKLNSSSARNYFIEQYNEEDKTNSITNGEVYKNIESSIKFFLGLESIAKTFERKDFKEWEFEYKWIKKIVDDNCFQEGVYSEKLGEYYSAIYRRAQRYESEGIPTLPLQIAKIFNKAIDSNRYLFKSEFEFYLKNSKTNEAVNIMHSTLSCIKCPDNYNESSDYNINDLILEAMKCSEISKDEYAELFSDNFNDEWKFMKKLHLSKYVIFDGSMRSDPKQVCQIYKNRFVTKNFNEGGKVRSFSLKSILFSNSDNCASDWEVKSFDAGDDITNILEQLFVNGTKKLHYVLYEQETGPEIMNLRYFEIK